MRELQNILIVLFIILLASCSNEDDKYRDGTYADLNLNETFESFQQGSISGQNGYSFSYCVDENNCEEIYQNYEYWLVFESEHYQFYLTLMDKYESFEIERELISNDGEEYEVLHPTKSAYHNSFENIEWYFHGENRNICASLDTLSSLEYVGNSENWSRYWTCWTTTEEKIENEKNLNLDSYFKIDSYKPIGDFEGILNVDLNITLLNDENETVNIKGLLSFKVKIDKNKVKLNK